MSACLDALSTTTFWDTMFFVFLASLSVILLLEQRKHGPFNLTDAITGDNGRVSLSKLTQGGAFLFTAWGFVHIIILDKMTEWYYGTFMIAWAGTAVLSRLSNVIPATKEGSNVTADAPGVSVNVKTGAAAS